MKLLSLEPESSASANSAIPAKMVGRDGFEPSKSVTADLQSAPFGHSGTYPYEVGAGEGNRTTTSRVRVYRTATMQIPNVWLLTTPVNAYNYSAKKLPCQQIRCKKFAEKELCKNFEKRVDKGRKSVL